MIGSPNPGWFVYDGDASDTASTDSTGSGVVEDVFVDFFESIGRETEPTAFDDRSDHARSTAGIRRWAVHGAKEKRPRSRRPSGGESSSRVQPRYTSR